MAEPDDQDTDFDFFRLVNKEFSPSEEIKMGIYAALDLAFGADAKAYYRGVKDD